MAEKKRNCLARLEVWYPTFGSIIGTISDKKEEVA